MNRPQPPASLFELDAGDRFEHAHDIEAWARTTFIDEGSTLENEEHAHLRSASIGFLWTNVDNARRGRTVIGQAEPGTPQGAMGKWAKARANQQVMDWFGHLPDFIITIHAGWWESASDAQACALIEHELYHCAQERDEFGQPKFNKNTGLPIFGMRGHDVETFIGVAARYGAVEPGVRELVDALNKPPLMTADMIGTACGTCLSRAA